MVASLCSLLRNIFSIQSISMFSAFHKRSHLFIYLNQVCHCCCTFYLCIWGFISIQEYATETISLKASGCFDGIVVLILY